MKRFLQVAVGLVLAVVVVPPLWFAVLPGDPPPELPPAGTRIVLGSGAAVNVIEAGTGPAVVMVHGLPGTAYDWRETSSAIAARGRRAIAYDRVGYGHSDPRSQGPWSPEANAEELVSLLQALDLRDATVVGWSYGGATAMTAALRNPERIGRLVLVGTGGPDSADAEPPEPPLLMRWFYSEPAMRWRRAVPPVSVGLMKILSNAAFSDGPQPAWWLEGLRANFARWDTLVTYRAEMMGLDADSTADFDPSRIAQPTLLLHGDDDRLAPIAIGRYLNTVLPDSKLIETPGGSHMLPVTHPEDIADQITAFSGN